MKKRRFLGNRKAKPYQKEADLLDELTAKAFEKEPGEEAAKEAYGEEDPEEGFEEGEYPEEELSEEEYPEGEYPEDEYAGDEEYAEDGEYDENGEYAEDGELDEDGEYDENGEYDEDGELDEEGEYAEDGELDEEGEYAEDGELDEDGEYAEEDEAVEDSGQAEAEEEAPEKTAGKEKPEEEKAETEEENAEAAPEGRKDKKDQRIDDLMEQLRRNMAEFDNYRKRTDKEKETSFELGSKNVIEKLLPILDNFERGLSTVSEEEKGQGFVAGMVMIYNQFVKMLTDMGVEPIEADGVAFDPNLHNAVMHEDNPDVGENIITQVFQKGYTYKGSVVRHAMVKVAN